MRNNGDRPEEFNRAGRTEEQKQVGQISKQARRIALLENIRQDTNNYLRQVEEMNHTHLANYQQDVNRVYTELLMKNDYTPELVPPGMGRNLMAKARNQVTQIQGQEREELKRGYENGVRDRINEAVGAERLEHRMQQYTIDRNAWAAQHLNTVAQMENAQTDAEKLRYGQVLENVERAWARTIERYMDDRNRNRDRGLVPEFGRRAHDIERG